MCKKEEEKKILEIDVDELEQVTGGGLFDEVPHVPEKPIDDSLRSKI